MKTVIQDIFLKQMQSIHKSYLIFLKIFNFFLKEKELEGYKNLFAAQKSKKVSSSHKKPKTRLNHGLTLKTVHKVIQFNQKAWLKPYIDMNTELRTEAENKFEEDFFKLMNDSVFGKAMENVRNHRDIKLVTSDKRRKRLVSEPNYHSHKKFSEHLMAIEMKKTKVKMTKPLYLGMSILDISKTLMYEFWYDYIKPKYGDRAKLCYMDTDSFVIHVIPEDFTKILLMMLKNGLIHLTMMSMIKDHLQKAKIKK